MTPQIRKFARIALWLLPLWTVLLFLGSITHQPDAATAFADFSAYVTTTSFLASHLGASITGAALGSIGVIGALLYLQDTKAAGKAIIGAVATVAANIYLTAIFGISSFAHPVMGRMYLAGEQSAVEFYNQVNGAPLLVTAMVGLLLFMIGGLFVGLAFAASGRLPRWAGWVYALGAVGYVVSFLVLPVGMSVFSILMTLVSAYIAWQAGHAGASHEVATAAA